MSRRWVVNASPLILLGKAGRLDLLRLLVDALLIPDTVEREVSNKPTGKSILEEACSWPSTTIVPLRTVPAEVEHWDLGPGESQVLAVAFATPDARAVVDDREARRCAQAIGVPVIGTLGIALRAKSKGLISAARPLVNDLRARGLYATDELVEKALEHLGE